MFEEHLNVLDDLVRIGTAAVLPPELDLGLQLGLKSLTIFRPAEIPRDV
ncbi:hypothetical protein ACFQ2K_05745 [Streptomyces sanglieri]|uniref:Uncharacterized protein n=1 Tax=Streptomyces sanglieri TaxID=193460 RepID=A0ABW2WLX5_9ACTN